MESQVKDASLTVRIPSSKLDALKKRAIERSYKTGNVVTVTDIVLECVEQCLKTPNYAVGEVVG